MTLQNWWSRRSVGTGQASEGGHKGGRKRLSLEPLEDRTVPNTQGTLAPTLGTDGTVSVPLSNALPDETLSAIAVQPDGKIIAAGGVNSVGGTAGEFAVARFKTDGSLDTSFGTGGSTLTNLITLPPGSANSTAARAVTIQPDGKIVLAGSYSVGGGLGHFALVRYNTDGSLDASFGTGGIVTTTVDGNDFATAVAVQSDGKLVVVGGAGPAGSLASDFAVLRYNTNGTLDGSFGTGGKVETPAPSGTDAAANAVLIQPDGKIVVGGHTSTSGSDFHFAVLRYNTNGSLDGSFGSGGEVFDNFGGSFSLEDVRGLALQADGKIVAAGSVKDSVTDREALALARYDPNGSLDKTFNGTGRTTLNLNGANDAAAAVTIQANGKIVVAGNDGASFLIAQYNADGTLDTAFGSAGTATQKLTPKGNDSASDLAIQTDGTIVVAGTAGEGTSSSTFALAEYVGIGQDTANVSLASNLNPAPAGTDVTLTANYAPSIAGHSQVTGAVTFMDGSSPIGSPQTLAGGVASVTTASLSLGNHTITAVYSGDGNYKGSTTTLVPNQVVDPVRILTPSTTLLSTSAAQTRFGGEVTFTAHVSGIGDVPTGSVKFVNATTGAALGVVALDASGAASFSTSTLAGRSTIRAEYSGDKTYQSSKGTVTQTVAAKPIVATSSAGGTVSVYDPVTGTLLGQMTPFGAYASVVKVATGDVNGDGYADLIMMVDRGSLNGQVLILSGRDASTLAQYQIGYPGEMNLAVGDVNGDGNADVILSTATNFDYVAVYSGVTQNVIANYQVFGGLTTGVSLAVGDFDGDGKTEVLAGTATQYGGAVLVNGMTGRRLATYILPVGTNGVSVAMGDFLGSGHAEVAIGTLSAISGVGPVVGVYDAASESLITGFAAYPGQSSGVRLASVDRNGDGHDEIVTTFTGGAQVGAYYTYDPSANTFWVLDGFVVPTSGSASSPRGLYVAGSD
jgi:uncharacterized delta-60 repeat protein